MKDLKHSTEQRFGGLDFDYPEEDLEVEIVAKGVQAEAACSMTMVTPLTDDPDMRDTLSAAVQTFFG